MPSKLKRNPRRRIPFQHAPNRYMYTFESCHSQRLVAATWSKSRLPPKGFISRPHSQLSSTIVMTYTQRRPLDWDRIVQDHLQYPHARPADSSVKLTTATFKAPSSGPGFALVGSPSLPQPSSSFDSGSTAPVDAEHAHRDIPVPLKKVTQLRSEAVSKAAPASKSRESDRETVSETTDADRTKLESDEDGEKKMIERRENRWIDEDSDGEDAISGWDDFNRLTNVRNTSSTQRVRVKVRGRSQQERSSLIAGTATASRSGSGSRVLSPDVEPIHPTTTDEKTGHLEVGTERSRLESTDVFGPTGGAASSRERKGKLRASSLDTADTSQGHNKAGQSHDLTRHEESESRPTQLNLEYEHHSSPFSDISSSISFASHSKHSPAL